ncbi:AAA family ATPase [Flavobacterium johnsoniae]|nr:AAA family ATPase [Flavobacterium johnsoniae]
MMKVDITELKSSWTKYDIVQVMEVVHDLETLEKFKTKEAVINEPILRSFLGVKKLSDPTPQYWIEIQKYPNEKKLFAFLATLFTHHEIIDQFAKKYSTEEMKGLFFLEKGKQYTNVRSSLIESGASNPIYRRRKEVPYDLTPILKNSNVGKLFKELLLERVARITTEEFDDEQFYKISYENNFHKALSLSEDQFKTWLEGKSPTVKFEKSYISKVEIKNFFSVENVSLDFDDSKEIYFLGENGDGKSLLLMGIYLAFNGYFVGEYTDQEKTGKIADIIKNNTSIYLSGSDSSNNVYNLQTDNNIDNLFAYGTHRGRYSSTNKPEEYGFMSLFNSDQTLNNPESWLIKQKLLELEQSDQFFFKSIENLELLLSELLEKNVEIKIEGTEVKFIEKGTPLSFDQLSEGYKSILIFTSDLLFRLSKNHNNKNDIFNSKATVLVDEIDLHLHPKWQRTIIGKLRTLFPHIQFIFTTHSPTIIQGASHDAIIYRVYRNADHGKTQVSDPFFRKNLDHLMFNTLMTSPLFGLEDSRLDADNDESDTSDHYLIYKIYDHLQSILKKQKENGKKFINDDEIDKLINEILEEEKE